MGQIKNIKLHIVTDIKRMDKIFSTKIDVHPEYSITACLLDNVTNTKQLLQLLLKGELNCALLNTTYLPDIFPVLVASTKSVHSHLNNSMKTKSIHTELLYNLSPTSSISTALKTLGIKGQETSVLVVCLHKGESNIADVVDKVDGEVRDIGELGNYSSSEHIRKLYGVTDAELQIGTYSDAVTLRIATKDAL